ncbi:hypothetical protein J2S03_000945 [Alicyclobacillus cycloheptanicus]|jgi:hypothetical protein|uniref:Secreted protein n=1 Tax=Alicyclobacillus cycloheptanicus TaxID=1457 RepID=A0ABT9XFQ7_9BACL|nr:hypothetical protein [Alicyclobacillus cycloheptanicus]
MKHRKHRCVSLAATVVSLMVTLPPSFVATDALKVVLTVRMGTESTGSRIGAGQTASTATKDVSPVLVLTVGRDSASSASRP